MSSRDRAYKYPACLPAFAFSETGHRYLVGASAKNARIAGWLIRLTTPCRDCFGVCFLHRFWIDKHERPNMALGGITPIQKLALADLLHFYCQL